MLLNAEVDLAIGPLAEPGLIVGAIRSEPGAEECSTVDRVALWARMISRIAPAVNLKIANPRTVRAKAAGSTLVSLTAWLSESGGDPRTTESFSASSRSVQNLFFIR
jgi:hypothetical protein